MAAPVSVRLDDDVRETLQAEARARHVGLSTYLRQIANEAAARLRRERIRTQSRAVAEYVESSPEATAFTMTGARRRAGNRSSVGCFFRRSDRCRGLARRSAEGVEQAASGGLGRG